MAAFIVGDADRFLDKTGTFFSGNEVKLSNNVLEEFYNISIGHRSHNELSYPLLLPEGRDRYRIGLELSEGSRARDFIHVCFILVTCLIALICLTFC